MDESEYELIFRHHVKKVISYLVRHVESPSDAKVIADLTATGMSLSVLGTILGFLPSAAVRLMLPQLNWPSSYIEIGESETSVLKSYADSLEYKLTLDEVGKFYAGLPDADKVLKLAGRSSEFRAINSLLQSGADLDDIVISRTVVNNHYAA